MVFLGNFFLFGRKQNLFLGGLAIDFLVNVFIGSCFEKIHLLRRGLVHALIFLLQLRLEFIGLIVFFVKEKIVDFFVSDLKLTF